VVEVACVCVFSPGALVSFCDSNVLCGQAPHTTNIQQQTEGYLAGSEIKKMEECS